MFQGEATVTKTDWRLERCGIHVIRSPPNLLVSHDFLGRRQQFGSQFSGNLVVPMADGGRTLPPSAGIRGGGKCRTNDVAANISEKERYSGWLRNPAQVDRWLLPLFIGFQPSFWWCRISQPSTVCMCMKIRITTIFEFSFLNPETSSDL